MNLSLIKNNGYTWEQRKGVYFKGYFQLREKNKFCVYKGNDAIEYFSSVETAEQLSSMLECVDGLYALVIVREDKILLAVDRARSMPLYYSDNGLFISDSADEIRKSLNIEKDEVDYNNYLALLCSDYLFGNNTVYSQIKQLDLGEILEICEGELRLKKYFYHLSDISVRSCNQIKKDLSEEAENAFLKLKEVIGNRPVVLSMSGGYDSRFVGCMLKNIGITDVSCYTYGKRTSFEVEQSRKNAEALGFRWTCVEYTDEEVLRAFDEVGHSYFDTYTGHDFTAYLQNFPAVRKLHEENWFKPNSIFITGLCGDMPTGSYVVPYDSEAVYNVQTAAEHLYGKIFTRCKMNDSFKKYWINEIVDSLEDLPLTINDYQSWVTAVDCFYTGTCHSHWFMHMNSVHSFFGYDWLIPFWNTDLLCQWYSIEADKRLKQKIYEEWLLEDVCAPYGISQKKYRASYSRNRTIRKLKYAIGSVLSFLCLHCGIPFKRSYDYNNFAPLELRVFKSLPCKKTVIYRKAGLPLLLNQYLLQRRYGIKNMIVARKQVGKK